MSDNDQPGGDAAATPELPPLPVDKIEDALPLLRRPFTPAAVKWKVQATWSNERNGPAVGAIIVGYIDARLVSERLNKVVGGSWSEDPVRVGDRPDALMYKLTVFDQTHVDVGISQGKDDGMKLKGVHSDALKRTAVRFGVGVPLYAMPEVRVDVTEDGAEKNDGTPTIKRRKDGKPGYLSEAVIGLLRQRYEDWLKAEGEESFGVPLDHGDASAGSVGYEDPEGEDDTPAASAGEPLSDDRSDELRAAARQLRDEIRAIDEDALAQQSFDAAMGQREHSHERLEDFIANLTELKANVERFEDLKAQLAEQLDEADLKKVVDRAQRRASRAERVEVLEAALAEATGDEGGDGNGE